MAADQRRPRGGRIGHHGRDGGDGLLTDRMTRIATLESRAAQAVRNLLVASAGRLPPVRAALANTLAELNAR